MRLFLFTFLFWTLCFTSSIAQDSDNILWSSVQFTKTLDNKNSVAFKPIIRHNQDITQYQNLSLDASYRRLLGKGWYGQFVTRYWFMPDRTNRLFLWYEIGYSQKLKKSKISSFVRYHNAIDIKGVVDPDFFRWKTKWTFPAIGKVTLEMSLEPWYRADIINDFVRMRYEPGINYKFDNKWTLSAVYRIEINKGTATDFYAGVINLGYKF